MRRIHWVVVVVILLVGLAAALLLPAINRVREVASRLSCTGRLTQMSFTLHIYAGAHSALPRGTVPNVTLPPERRLSWYVSILPYFEQASVYQQFDLKTAADDERNRTAASAQFPQSVCPSSGEYEYNGHGGKWKSPTPLMHYIGVAGVGADAATLPAGHAKAGAFGYDRVTALSKEGFPDGTSNTLLLIETASVPGHWAFGGPPTVRGLDPGTAPYIGPGRPFGGFHDGGRVWRGQRSQYCNVALADGSSRIFSDNTSSEVLEALATVAGKEALPDAW